MSAARRRVGAFTSAGLVVLLVVVAGWIVVDNRPATITLTAQFDSAAGLYVGNAVAVLGMPVGAVTSITPKGGYVEVEFTVDEDVKIPEDVQAVTLSTSILTDRQIELTPPYRGGPTLPDHATIGLHRTKTPVEFARVLDMLDKLSTSLQGDRQGGGPIADVVDAGAQIAAGNGEDMKAALNELSKALRLSADGGAQTRDQMTTIIGNVSSLFDTAAVNDAKLREFGTTIRQLSQIMADEQLGSGTTGKKLNEVLHHLGAVLENNREHIEQIVRNGDTATTTTVEHRRDLAEFLDVAPMTLDNIYNAIDEVNGAVRVRVLTDRVLFESQTIKEVCNMMGLRQLGCSTGTLQDFGPDFGLTYMLDGLAAMGQK